MRKKLVVVFSAIMLLALTGFTVREWYDCKTCGGDGIMDARSCRSCGGDGEVTNRFVVQIVVARVLLRIDLEIR